MELQFYLDRVDRDFSSEDRKQVFKDMTELINIFGYLMNVLAEENIEEDDYKYPISILINKFILHLYSITDLLKGKSIKSEYLNFEKYIIDISSVYTLTRTALETYLTFFYLYVHPSNNEESYFRYKLLELAGLRSRQRNKAELEEHIKMKREESVKISEIEKIVYDHPQFLKLSKNTRDKIKGRRTARIFSWENLIQEADLNLDLFESSWYLYSEFVHSEYVSQIQLYRYLTEPSSSVEASNTLCVVLLALISVFIIDTVNLYKEIEQRYNSLSDTHKEFIIFFNNLGRKPPVKK